MHVKSMMAFGVLVSAFATSEARADEFCTLNVNPWSYIQINRSFSYVINIQGKPLTQPLPSPLPPPNVFTIVFHGSKNGVEDIPPTGETYPGSFNYGTSELTGYWNPGGVSGTYLRYAVITNQFGSFYCTTNTIAVVLE